ncbi:hypothetical protein NFI96_031402, partial [Prochilodus magdalenae]
MGSRLCNQIFPASCVSGASGTEWSVTYNQQEICALEGSTVFMNGSYIHPEHLTVNQTFWVIDPVQGKDPIYLSKVPGYSGRVETLTDDQKHFSLRLSDVMKKDEHQYCFRITTYEEGQNWAGTPGVQLRVTDLSVEAPGEVTEGGTAVLTCRTTCSLTDQTFIWFKNGRPLTTNTIKNNQLHLQTVSSEDAGSYSCAIGGYQHLRSTDQNLRVRFLVSAVCDYDCRSDGNPPVKIYTWLKGSTSVGNGDTYYIPNIRSEHSGDYTCQSRNEHGERRSTAVQINVQYPPKSVSLSISGHTLEGSSATLTCSSDGNPPVKIYTWYKEGGASPVGSGHSYSITSITAEHTGLYYCVAQNEHGAQNGTVMVTVKSRWWKRQNRNLEQCDYENADPNAKEDTYTALQPTARSSDDVYHTLGVIGLVGKELRYCTAAVMRSFRMAPPLPLLFLLMAVGAFGAKWGVMYNQQEICALEGSTVFMNGTYTHPEHLTVTETFWIKEPDEGKEPIDLRQDSSYSGRVETLTDEQKHFSLRLSDVMKKDEHQYVFRIITNVQGQNWAGTPGVQLRVTDLSVEAPGEVTEGGTAVLTCRTTCSLTDPTFIWYKNGRPLTTKTIKNNQLHLQTVSSEDAGSYSCAVGGYQHLRSTNQNLRVRYPPKKVSVSIFPSGEIMEGSSVTLTCSSDANPPVKIYTWFKGSTSVGNGDTYYIPNIRSEHSGEYTCLSRNEHEEGRSTAVQINVRYPPTNVSVSIFPSAEIVEGSSVTLTCSSDANPPVKIYTWFKGSTPVGNGDSYYIPNIRSDHSGEYTCLSRNEHGEGRSTAVQINVRYPPTNVSVSISPSAEIVEGSSVTLTCSSDANPPVKIYTWFKGSTPVGNGDIYNIPNIRSDHSGEYTCLSRNEHGEGRSTAVQINVRYPPTNVSVSISPSAEIVEGSSVTLTCSSDANPPVKIYTWFKGSTPVGNGDIYNIPNIRSDHSGEYTCLSRNEHGEGRSTAVQINVRYPPTNVSVSISPSAEIVEGSSVTLTCSSDANPPVKIYTWFKGSISVGNGDTYYIPNIRSEHSGEYTCQSRNDHGEGRSTAVQINVQYPPKSVSVSISGHTLEGSSATLTCSSDGNPPVKIYTWFKEGGASPVGSGHSYSITSITAEHTGLYYCVAQNEHGAQNGTVMVTVKSR